MDATHHNHRKSPMSDHAPLTIHWLVRLRWAAIAAQCVSILGVRYLLRAPFPLAPLAVVVGALTLANVVLEVTLRRGRSISDRAVAGNLLLDIAALTALLVWTGGAMNPFTTLYLLEVALAGILVSRRWSLVVTVGAVAAFGALLVARPEAVHVWHSAGMFLLHVRGMWLAFALTAGCLWYFVDRVNEALRRREGELAAARIEAERARRLVALGTLAAGTAHELNTPLGTVVILASELSEILVDHPEAQALTHKIRAEVRRCKSILLRMRSHEHEPEESVSVSVGDWLPSTVGAWGRDHDGAAVSVRINVGAMGLHARVRPEALRQAVVNLLDNAWEATHTDVTDNGRISVSVLPGTDNTVVIEVADNGVGIAPEHLARLGEPFFTTREPGRGMGMGLFLVQAVVSQHRGTMHVESVPGDTRVRVTLPVAG